MPSSTFFTAPPDWHWLVILYFFFGGIAGGSYLIAALIDLFGRVADRPLARLGYIVAFVAAIFCPTLPDFPIPTTTTFPRWRKLSTINSTARMNAPSS